MTASLAKRRLIEPDYWTCPHGVRVRPEPALTYGPEVAELCAKAGYAPDPQQELGLDLVFAIRPDGSPASFSFCVICARQNLKSGLFQQCVLGWFFVTEVPEVAWSAHELRTSLNAQRELYDTIENSFLSKYLPATKNAGLYDQNGKERIELNTGQTCWFQTRTRDGGRGLGKPKVIIDEAFKFKLRTAGALLPILLAQHHPQLLRGSSAPPLDEDAADLRDVIERGRKRMSPEMSYLEWLAEREECATEDCLHPKDALSQGIDCALDREHLLLQANPTVDRDDQGKPLDTGRITIRTLRNLRQELAPDEYMRECLGWMDDAGDMAGPPAINIRTWTSKALNAPDTPAPKRAALVIDVAPDRSRSSIGVAGTSGSDGRVLLLSHTKPGFAWVVPQLVKLRNKGDLDILELSLLPTGQAGVLLPDLLAAGFEVTTKEPGEQPGRLRKLTSSDVARGCAALQHAVLEQRILHLGQDEITDAVAVARTRQMPSEAETWDRREQAFEISPVVSIATALHRWDLVTAVPDVPPPSPRRASAGTGRTIDRVGF
ncbi:hypothetical protein [Nocardioides jensenii]|uniref:hypothetical protein n=1 Tax=Nocardioides jensenii TaxID=1843 RepID=UPI00082AA351|nr:hypothetical protein [Nocardioides jensenii]